MCAFALDAKPGVALTGRMLNSWQAHRIGSVTVLITTPWGELWSGSSRGIIRVWRNAHKQGGGAIRPVNFDWKVVDLPYVALLQVGMLDVQLSVLRSCCHLDA